ncbi:MAG: TolC family protein [Bacteroidales bacterium]|nr:TolC family protein [Bacteroidales bacterium]
MRKLFIWLLITSSTFTAVQAQGSTAPIQKSWSFSLDQAKDYALQYNRSMKKAGLASKQAQLAKWAAIANYLPQTSVSMMYNNYMGTELKLLEGMDPIKMVPTATATFQATQVIFNANVLVGIQLAELSKQMSENNFLQTELSIKQSVSTAYYSILVSEDNKRILEKNVENIRTLVKATHAKVGVGIGEQTEADQMDVTLANLENTLQSVNQNIELAYNSMHLILGIGVNDELKLTDPLNILTERCNSYELLAQPFELENNHDMKASELGLEMSKKQYDSSIASMLPSLAAVYQHNEKVMSGGFDMTMKNTLVLSASVPLVVGGKNVSGVKKARLAYESSRLDNDLAKDQLLLQEKQLRYNLKTAQTSYELQKKNIEVSQRVFDNITKKYEQGLSSSLELTTANNNLLTAQSNYINAVMSLLNAQDSLKKLLGLL